MSDRLDIVRLIDAKVTSSRRAATRSKQFADAARTDLHVHEDWLRQHRERSDGDLKRHQRRMKRQERFENNKRFATSAVLFLPRLCAGVCRGVAAVLRKADHAVFTACAGFGRTASALGSSSIGFLAAGVAWAGAKTLALGLMLLAALWLLLSGLGKTALAIGVAFIDKSSAGLSWLGPKASEFGRMLAAHLSLSLSRLTAARAAARVAARPKARGAAKLQASHLLTRLRPRTRAADRTEAAALDPGRLRQADFIRLRAEHERLQARIHAMDRHYEQRLSHRGRTDAREWVELRKLAQDARRLFEVQQRHVLGPARREAGGSPPPRAGEAHPALAHLDPLSAGHAIYDAPALVTGVRRARH